MVDPLNCSEGSKLDLGVITITTDATSGDPIAIPEKCYVQGKGRVVFQTPKNATRSFTIRFDKGQGSPSSDNDGSFVGRPAGANGFVAEIEKLKPGKSGTKQQFDYSIEIDGRKSDPSIIIDW